jgi:hypothetical protein
LTSAVDGGGRSVSHSGYALPLGMGSVTHWIGGWVGLRASLDAEARGKILCPCQDRIRHSVRSHSNVTHYSEVPVAGYHGYTVCYEMLHRALDPVVGSG